MKVKLELFRDLKVLRLISFTFRILRVKPMASCRALVGAQTLDQILLLSVILSDIKETRKKLFQ